MLSICDLQERFRPAIHGFPHVLAMTQKLLRASRILSIPVVATTQLRAKLGPTCAELRLDDPDTTSSSESGAEERYPTLVHADKSLFSGWVPSVRAALAPADGAAIGQLAVALVGIESHICITQTALDLLRDGHQVYVLADAVSSCNRQEVPIALQRLRQAGATVTTTESWLYEVVGDAERKEFREIARLVKEESGRTREAVGALGGL